MMRYSEVDLNPHRGSTMTSVTNEEIETVWPGATAQTTTPDDAGKDDAPVTDDAGRDDAPADDAGRDDT